LTNCTGACDSKNITVCLSCADGFQLLNNKCIRCPQSCATCSNGQCKSCVFGFNIT
jgi:hypothetical protein